MNISCDRLHIAQAVFVELFSGQGLHHSEQRRKSDIERLAIDAAAPCPSNHKRVNPSHVFPLTIAAWRGLISNRRHLVRRTQTERSPPDWHRLDPLGASTSPA